MKCFTLESFRLRRCQPSSVRGQIFRRTTHACLNSAASVAQAAPPSSVSVVGALRGPHSHRSEPLTSITWRVTAAGHVVCLDIHTDDCMAGSQSGRGANHLHSHLWLSPLLDWSVSTTVNSLEGGMCVSPRESRMNIISIAFLNEIVYERQRP